MIAQRTAAFGIVLDEKRAYPACFPFYPEIRVKRHESQGGENSPFGCQKPIKRYNSIVDECNLYSEKWL